MKNDMFIVTRELAHDSPFKIPPKMPIIVAFFVHNAPENPCTRAVLEEIKENNGKRSLFANSIVRSSGPIYFN